ncbi:MAG: inorganic diphosphatase [Bacteroidota bacterium]|nr:inorganic diphosphatase [Bacteroidota bacterium]
MKHPWHNVDPEYDGIRIIGLIEISKGKKSKYEIDKKSGLLKLDRVLYGSFYYPVNYGFIPKTMGEDGDPLDILVISQIDIQPLCLVQGTIIGVMHMVDQGLIDDKIIAVASRDESVNSIRSLQELPRYMEAELRQFFENYTVLENKTVSISDFSGKERACEIVEASLKSYDKWILENIDP